jgi:hypothetical protein
MAETKDVNKIKVMHIERKRSNMRPAVQLGKTLVTVSKWCVNTSQSTLETYLKKAEVPEVNYTKLMRSESVFSLK